MSLPHCPKCNSEYTYEDNGMYICPECAYEWNDAEPAQESDELIVKDANGNLLADGDSVTIIKDLKVKGSSSMLKIGTKVKNIRLVEGDHNIADIAGANNHHFTGFGVHIQISSTNGWG